MQVPDFETVHSLLSTYVAKRPRRGPFPLESALTWCVLLTAQADNGITGDMLEIGVQYGTTAFLMLESLRRNEHATFIDLEKTAEWIQGIEGPYRDQASHSYIVANSMDLGPKDLPSACRWIHVDGGHLYDCIASDLNLVSGASSDDGITVMDDFFEISWPDVTVAVTDHLRRDDRLIPFLLVNRKLYCARTPESASRYVEMFGSFLTSNQSEVGQVQFWDDVIMMGTEISVAKMVLPERILALER